MMTELPAGGEPKFIHVNRPALVENRKDVFIIRQPGKRTIFARRVVILGPSELVNRRDEPQGRRVAVETTSAVRYE